MLCLTGEVGWARLSPPRPEQASPGRAVARLVGATPDRVVSSRARRSLAGRCAQGDATDRRDPLETLSDAARAVSRRFAPAARRFFASWTWRRARSISDAARGRASASSSPPASSRRTDSPACGRSCRASAAGRPCATARRMRADGRCCGQTRPAVPREAAVEAQAWALLRRYGVVFRRAAAARGERRAVARAGARLPPARGARRDSRRTIRVGHVRRAVRARRRGRSAARRSGARRPTAA